MNTQDFFSNLRTIFQNPPGQQTWSKFVQLTTYTPNDASFIRNLALPYAHDHLNHWPKHLDHIRKWPQFWLNQLSNHPSQWGILAKHLQLDHTNTHPTQRPLLTRVLPYASFINHLSISGSQRPPLIEHLEQFLNQSPLVSLNLNHIPFASLETTLTTHHYPNLNHLKLNHIHLSDKHIPNLINTSWMKQLHTLDLQHNHISDASAHQLLTLPWQHLTALHLLHNPIEGFAFTHPHPHLKQLQHLSFGQCTTSPTTQTNQHQILRNIWHSQSLQQLKSLTYHCPQLSHETVSTLLTPTALKHLQTLNIQTTHPLESNAHTYIQKHLQQHQSPTFLINTLNTLIKPKHTHDIGSFLEQLPFPNE